MRELRCVLSGLVLLVGLTACKDTLTVDNINNPDRDRVLARPADVEALIGTGYQSVHRGTLGAATVPGQGGGQNDALQPQLIVMGLESYSGLANFNMGPRAGRPRAFINNQRGDPGSAGNFRDFFVMSSTARTMSNALARLGDADVKALFSSARIARALAFAKFVQGAALGNLALAYDSGVVASESDVAPSGQYDPNVVYPLVDYNTLMAAAMGDLDSAISTAQNAPAGANGFPLLSTWINGNALTAANFIRLVRSHKARFRAGVARNPAERAAVDWTKVIDDANNGITGDLVITMSTSAGWTVSWPVQHYLFQTWHQMAQLLIGMAAVADSGQYDSWLALPDASKTPFLIRTPDKRWPAGTTRAAQNKSSGAVGPVEPTVPASGLYFRNRLSGDDVLGEGWANSFYDFYRFQTYFNNGLNGPYPVMTRPEMDLLMAEGYIRTGQWALAAQKIDITRVARGGLTALTGAGIADLTTPVPGGASCVPRVPVGPSFTTTACGNILEAMKWEKRMETAFTGYGMWYFDSRGWGDLPVGTAIHWPVPWQEMDTRLLYPFFSPGGVGQPSGAALGTYRF